MNDQPENLNVKRLGWCAAGMIAAFFVFTSFQYETWGDELLFFVLFGWPFLFLAKWLTHWLGRRVGVLQTALLGTVIFVAVLGYDWWNATPDRVFRRIVWSDAPASIQVLRTFRFGGFGGGTNSFVLRATDQDVQRMVEAMQLKMDSYDHGFDNEQAVFESVQSWFPRERSPKRATLYSNSLKRLVHDKDAGITYFVVFPPP